jgi:hypothetical protein
MKSCTWLFVLGFLILPSSGSAQTWTAVGSGGAIQDNSISTYGVGNGVLTFRAGATGNVQAIYNVTNPRDSGNPSWTTLEFRANNPGGALGVFATAILYRQPRTSTSAIAICSAVAPPTGTTTTTCTFSSTTFDFANNYYFVRVSLGRTSGTQSVQAHAVRTF